MNYNWFLAILVIKGILDKEVADELAVKLDSTTYAHDFSDAYKDIKKIIDDLEK